MKKYSYIGGKVLKVGGKVVLTSDLTKLDANTLKTAVKNGIIAEEETKKEKENGNGKRKTRENTESGEATPCSSC